MVGDSAVADLFQGLDGAETRLSERWAVRAERMQEAAVTLLLAALVTVPVAAVVVVAALVFAA